jgi:uncharacterized protein
VLAALEVPYLSGRVVDEAGLLDAAQKARIETRLATIEEQRGSQIAVLTVPSLEDEVLEDYSLRVAETWKLGRDELDDGALLLVARDDRKMRLEVGYGLEAVLTDATSRRILDDVMRPRFRAGDFGGGIEDAILAIEGVLAGDEGALPPPAADGGGISGDSMPWPARAGFFIFFLFVVGIFSLTALFSQGCAGWFLYLFLMPFWLAFPLAILGTPFGWLFLPAWLVGFPILRSLTAGARKKGTMPGWLGGGTLPRGWSSSRGWGGGGFSGGGGGFSGGGGSFGGGGASSSW